MGDPATDPMFGLGFKSINAGKTQISGVEFSVSSSGEITKDLTINILAGYTYMNPISLSPDEALFMVQDSIPLTYSNSSSDPSVLKYRYKNIAKLDGEIVYKKYILGTSLRYNDFMQNVDKIFTEDFIGGDNGMIPGINTARKQFENGDFIIDGRIAYNLNDNFRLGIIVNNILNREYMSRPADMEIPRTYAFQLSMKL